MSRRRARSPIGTGPSPERPSSASARSAYGLFVVIEITAPMLRPTGLSPQRGRPRQGRRRGRHGPAVAGPADRPGRDAPRSGLQPAALGGDEDGLGAVDRAELAVDVVQVRAHGARRERELVGDLLVDAALGEALEDLELA